MNLLIVGHGVSLQNSGLGPEIDEFDSICRLKLGHLLRQTDPENYGTRMDYLCSTLKTWGNYWTLRLKEYWGYMNFPGQDRKIEAIQEHFGRTPVRLEKEAVEHWLEVYREMADVRADPSTGASIMAPEGDEPWPSTGMGAVIIAAASGLFSEIYLAGYDTTLRSKREGKEGRKKYKSVLRPDGHTYPPHGWEIEAAMLPLLDKHYDTPIYFWGRSLNERA